MKKLMVLALMLIVVFESKSQIFEGTVKWTMKMEITDPKLKAQMAEAEKKMNDPATQAQMKQLQDKMNDPQFKAQMDANPQMKAMIESQLKMVQGGGGANGMMPTGMTMKTKAGNAVTIINGGMMDGIENLYLKDKNQSVTINRKDKTYTIHPAPGTTSGQPKAPEIKFTKTSETMKILGYTCTKYIGTMTENGKTINEIFWTTTELKGLDLKALASQRMGAGNRGMIPEGLEGAPLRVEMSVPQGSTIMEMVELKKETLADSNFVIPSDFKEVKATGKPY